MIGSLFKATSLLLMNKTVKNIDIAASYDKVCKKYEKNFLDIMHSHNDKLLDKLVKELGEKHGKEGYSSLRILDLACGTGYNTRYLQGKGIDADYGTYSMWFNGRATRGSLKQGRTEKVNLSSYSNE